MYTIPPLSFLGPHTNTHTHTHTHMFTPDARTHVHARLWRAYRIVRPSVCQFTILLVQNNV